MLKHGLVKKIKGGFNGWISINYDFSCMYHPKQVEALTGFVTRKPINTLVEIGTHEGLSTVHLADFCKKVVTFDRRDYLMKYKLWYDYNKQKNIEFHLIKNDDEKRELLKDLDFDFAFIDGDHQAGVIMDFELVKKCGRVLFHDYNNDNPRIAELYHHIIDLVDSLPKDEVEFGANLAFWEKK